MFVILIAGRWSDGLQLGGKLSRLKWLNLAPTKWDAELLDKLQSLVSSVADTLSVGARPQPQGTLAQHGAVQCAESVRAAVAFGAC